MIGAEAIREMLAAIDLPSARGHAAARGDGKEATGELKPKKLIQALKLSRASSIPATARNG
jgi:hypothetical protein